MEPQIRYTTTADGVRLAFSVTGDGAPLVQLAWFRFSHLEMERQIPEVRRWFEQMEHGHTLVRFDGRGTGLSARDVHSLTFDSLVEDLECVADQTGLSRFALFGLFHSTPVALAYAARHPERVSHLVLWRAYANASSAAYGPVIALLDLIESSWEIFTETLAHTILGWAEGNPARRVAEVMRASMTPETARRVYDVLSASDVTSVLHRVTAPTLVLHRREVGWPAMDVAQEVCAQLPDARMVVLEGTSGAIYLGDWESAARALLEFVDNAPARAVLPSGTAIILFADIVDSTATTERIGDAAFRERARALDVSMRAIITDAEGTAIEGKLLGDGVLATFPAASQAIDAALRCAAAGDAQSLPLHVGLHAGDVIREQNNVFGGAVNIASRISGLSAPGEVLVSDVVRALARTSASVTFEDRGEHALKGVSDAQRVYAVRPNG